MIADENPYIFLTFFLGIALLFPLTPLLLAELWARKYSPAKPGPEKNATYECGLASKAPEYFQFKPQYYLYAILFLIFDVESLFLFPFAAAFLQLSFSGFLAMMLFVLLLAETLAWAWMKGALQWK